MKNSKLSFVATLMLCSIAGSAFAGSAEGPVDVVTTDQINYVNTTDWSGFYLGASYGFADDTMGSYQNGIFSGDLFIDGESLGGFVGYNFQRVRFVYGAELAYAAGPFDSVGALHSVTTQDYFDLKLRAGYTMGRVMLYGFAGYSTATMYENAVAPAQTIDGMNFGAGIDYQITDRFFVGLEYVARDLSGDFDQVTFPGWTFEGPSSSINLRVGLSF